jgi:hypothetical protein
VAATIICQAQVCSFAIPGYSWAKGVTISAGDGSPGTYRTSHPAASNAARCKSGDARDTFEATLEVTARTVRLRATAPGFGFIRCSSTETLARSGATWSFSGILVP